MDKIKFFVTAKNEVQNTGNSSLKKLRIFRLIWFRQIKRNGSILVGNSSTSGKFSSRTCWKKTSLKLRKKKNLNVKSDISKLVARFWIFRLSEVWRKYWHKRAINQIDPLYECKFFDSEFHGRDRTWSSRDQCVSKSRYIIKLTTSRTFRILMQGSKSKIYHSKRLLNVLRFQMKTWWKNLILF